MRLFRAILTIGALMWVNGAAIAEICVSCTGPQQAYLCSVKKADKIETFAGAKALNKICVKVLKRSGQHATCQVVEASAARCTGVPKTIGWRDVKDALAGGDDDATPTAATAPAPAAKTPAATKVSPPAPTVSKVPDSEKSAGPANAGPEPPAAVQKPVEAAATPEPEKDPSLADNIKGAAEKTWSCVSSLFGKC